MHDGAPQARTAKWDQKKGFCVPQFKKKSRKSELRQARQNFLSFFLAVVKKGAR